MAIQKCFKCGEPVWDPKHALDMGGYHIYWCDECYPFSEVKDESDADEELAGDLLDL